VYMWLLVHALSSTTGKLMLAFSIFDVYDPFDTSHCLKVTSHLRGSPSGKNCTRASLINTPTNYIHVSEKKLNKSGLRSKYNSSEFSFRKCQKPVRR